MVARLLPAVAALLVASHAPAQQPPTPPAAAPTSPAAGAKQAAPPAAALPERGPERVMTEDVVLAHQGRSIPGSRVHAVDFEGNTYLFSSAETKAAFEREPARYAAAFGGACGRTGPLGGLGDARRWAIEGGKLYFFDSDECAKLFRVDPKRFVELEDPFPIGTPEAQAAGMAAIDRWVAWAGGADAVRAVKRVLQASTREVEQADGRWSITESIELVWPGTVHRIETWTRLPPKDGASPTTPPKGPAAYRYETIVSPSVSAISSSLMPPMPLADSRKRAVLRNAAHLPASILRARFTPEAGFLAVRTGSGKVGTAECDFVATYFDGTTTWVAIEKETGRLAQIGYNGRDTQARVSPLTLDVVAYAGPEALRLPTQWITARTGETEGWKSPVATITVEK